MTDIRTTREIDVGRFTVRVGEQETGSGYDAAVIAYDELVVDLDQAPVVSHERKYAAAGKAVSEFRRHRDGSGGGSA